MPDPKECEHYYLPKITQEIKGKGLEDQITVKSVYQVYCANCLETKSI